MIITCPKCDSRYKIDPSRSSKQVVTVKCPGCAHRFEVSLETAPAASADVVVREETSRPLMLVVDDARFFREMIKDILKALPIELQFAADGNEAWRFLQERTPRLLLLDLNIPGKSGYDLLREIQGGETFSQMTILVMSGVERGAQVASEVSRLGADGFVSKSFTPKELQNRVRDILGL